MAKMPTAGTATRGLAMELIRAARVGIVASVSAHRAPRHTPASPTWTRVGVAGITRTVRPVSRDLAGRADSVPGMVAVAAGTLSIRLLDPRARPPARTREGDAGYDLRCLDGFTLQPGERATVGTGVAIALPPGIAGLVTPRSGLAARHGISVVNGPGLVDPNYRGELRVVLVNHGSEPFAAAAGDRIAQLLLVPYWAPELQVVEELPLSDREANGFGSSGSA
jgi:dUTP pyrophosphatase